MRILLVTHYYSTHAGGIEIVAGTLAGELAASEDVAWAASDCDPAPAVPLKVRLVPMRSFNGIEKLTGLPFPLWGFGSLRRLWRETGEANVVHMHDVVYPGNWAAFLFARLRQRPVVITQHAGLIRYRSELLALMLRTLHHTFGRMLLAGATQIVFVSPVVRDYYAGFVRFERPPEIIYNGVDGDLYTPGTAHDRAEAREQFGFDASHPVVLFVGRFVEAKGLRLIEQLARRLPDTAFALAGWGPVDPESWAAPNVKVFRGLRGSTLAPLYRAADLLVLPSLGEGLPLVVQEALACGTPALVDSETARAVGAPDERCARVPDDWTPRHRSVDRRAARVALRNGRTDYRDERSRFARERWSWKAAATRYMDLFANLSAPEARARAR